MNTQHIAIVSIRPDAGVQPAIDIIDILHALGARLSDWIWCIRNLDWLGEDAEATCAQVEAAAPGGLWLPSQELVQRARKIQQTVEGEFLAFPATLKAEEIDIHETSLAAFPESRAELAIVAVDGCYIEVYAKDPNLLTAMRHFHNIREEDPAVYF